MCVPYRETLEEEARRMAGYFQDWRPWQAIDPIAQLPISEALKLYGLGSQARDGNVKDPAPSMLDISERLKWNAWRAEHNKSRMRAAHELIKLAREILDRFHVDYSDFNAGPKQKEYQDCVDQLLSTGKSMDAIKAAGEA